MKSEATLYSIPEGQYIHFKHDDLDFLNHKFDFLNFVFMNVVILVNMMNTKDILFR